jgi:tRNA nucleotidyltransferase (CCA-adding enzyme)
VLPTVEDSSIKLDLHRRDFTINTLALCLNEDRWGELLDFWGGVNDLKQGIIRILHSLSFVDDPTRILRAVRYEQRFNFTIEPRSLELLRDAIELLDRVTPARIRHELERILQEEMPEKSLARLQELGVLARLHPALNFEPSLAEAFASLRAARAQANSDSPLRAEAIELLYWGILVAKVPASAQAELATRLGLRGETQRLMASLARLHRHMNELERPNLPPSRVVALLEPVNAVALALLPIIYAPHTQMRAYAERYGSSWQHIQPELDGHDLAKMGVPRGPIYSKLLDTLRDLRLDGILTTRDDEVAYVRSYMQLP